MHDLSLDYGGPGHFAHDPLLTSKAPTKCAKSVSTFHRLSSLTKSHLLLYCADWWFRFLLGNWALLSTLEFWFSACQPFWLWSEGKVVWRRRGSFYSYWKRHKDCMPKIVWRELLMNWYRRDKMPIFPTQEKGRGRFTWHLQVQQKEGWKQGLRLKHVSQKPVFHKWNRTII